MNFIKLSFFIVFFLVSCSDSKKEKVTPKDKGVTNELIKKDVFYFDSSSAKIIWNGFKTTDKIKVTGQFLEFSSSRDMKEYGSLEELIDGLDFEIYTNSSESGDAVRDLNLKDYFFNKLTENFTLNGTLGRVVDGMIPVTFETLLGPKTVSLNYSFDKDLVQIKGVINVKNDLGGLAAYESIHKKCEQLHTGGDGISKTWDQVEVLIKVPIITN